jgi:nucleotide-binding universal stress UspA family protein
VVGAARRLRAAGLAVEEVAGPGEPAELIVEAGASAGADLIVMATHGRTGLDRWLHGSVADAVLRRADVPVLLTKCGMDPIWTPGGPLRVLVPLDGSELAERALPIVEQLAARVGVEALLLRAVPPSTGDPSAADGAPAPAADASVDAVPARDYLAGVARRLRSTARRVDLLVEAGEAPAVISEVARARSAHLVAMTTHARGGVARLLLGSVAVGVIERAAMPLLLVPPTP